MTGDEFRKIRTRLGLSRAAFGMVLGYSGKPQNINSIIGAMEKGSKAIMPWMERLAIMYSKHGVPKDWIPAPDWSKEE